MFFFFKMLDFPYIGLTIFFCSFRILYHTWSSENAPGWLRFRLQNRFGQGFSSFFHTHMTSAPCSLLHLLHRIVLLLCFCRKKQILSGSNILCLFYTRWSVGLEIASCTLANDNFDIVVIGTFLQGNNMSQAEFVVYIKRVNLEGKMFICIENSGPAHQFLNSLLLPPSCLNSPIG